MTHDTDERRAALLLRYSEFVVQTEEQFLELARAIRASDEAAGMVLVPRELVEALACDCADHQCEAHGFEHTRPAVCAHAKLRAMIAATEAEAS